MLTRRISLLIIALLLQISAIGAEPHDKYKQDAEAVREVLDEAIAAINKKDVDGNMRLMHPESPNYQATLQKTKVMLETYDITTEIVEYDFVGVSGGYAFARVRQKNTMRKGGFKGTSVELVYSLRKHKQKWKFWSIMQLSMEIEK